MADAVATKWTMKGRVLIACNCDWGCPCNVNALPTKGNCEGGWTWEIEDGAVGDVKLNGLYLSLYADWPKAIHEGNGKAAFIVDPATSDKQVEALAQIFTGKLGGMPWEVLGPTFEVVGLTKAKITVEGSGRSSTFRIEGIGEARGDTLKNPVTGEDHIVNVDLPTGFIWKKGEVGQGTFHAAAAGLSVDFQKTNWIYYQYDWSNAA